MRKNLLILLTLIAASQAFAEKKDVYELNTGQFDKIKVLDNINVIYTCLSDSTGYAWYEGEKKFADIFEFSTKSDGTLRIRIDPAKQMETGLPTVHIYSDFLLSAENSGNGTLIIRNPAPTAELKLSEIGNGTIEADGIKANKVNVQLNTGNGTLNVSGTCETADLRMLGAGLISADRLKANNVNCRILGTGSIGCWPVDNLNVKGLGTTKIYYKGNPKIKKSGGGKLFELPYDTDDEIPDWGALESTAQPVELEESMQIEIVNDEDDEDDEDDDDSSMTIEEDDDDYQTVVTADD